MAAPSSAWKWRSSAVMLSIGFISFFQVYHDSVVDNLLPVTEPWLIEQYGSLGAAHTAWSLLVSIRQIGEFIGCILSIFADRYGRKIPLLINAASITVGGILCAAVSYLPLSLWPAIVGRLLIGFGAGMAQVVGSAMLAEIPATKNRGCFLGTLTMWSCVGELGGMSSSLPVALGTPDLWPWAMTVGTLFAPIALLILMFAPDSPRYLLDNGRREEARDALKFYQSSEDWQACVEDVESERAEMDSGEKYRPWGLHQILDRFKDRRFIYPMVLASILEGFAHVDDWVWLSYSTKVFLLSGVRDDRAPYASLFMSIPQAIVAIVATVVLDRFSRRDIMIIPTLGSALCAAAAIISVSLPVTLGFTSATNSIVLLATADLVMTTLASEGIYAVVPELFGQRDRVLGTALAGATQNLTGSLITMVVLKLVVTVGCAYTLAPFVVINICYAIFIWAKVPETGGKDFSLIGRSLQATEENASAERLIADDELY
uniref:Major facilitator superfamily (MFS) profile domain-containing protein n=1 Tax=Plectus sambesii TaxID=2011161 RepID=A0A914W121_9BILA